jgi:hypothetical protein
MTNKQPPNLEHDRDSVEENATHIPEASNKSPLERFKVLTRQIIGVTREQMAEEQARYESTRGSSPRGSRPSRSS